MHQQSLPNVLFQLTKIPWLVCWFCLRLAKSKAVAQGPLFNAKEHLQFGSILHRETRGKKSRSACRDASQPKAAMHRHARAIHSRRRNHSPRCGITTNLFEGVEQIKTHGGQAIVIAVAVHLRPCVSHPETRGSHFTLLT